ncbi:MAG: MAC/perforin domain-containing protein [Verrucomicrobiota bacterium]
MKNLVILIATLLANGIFSQTGSAQDASSAELLNGVVHNDHNEVILVYAWNPEEQNWIPEPFLELQPGDRDNLAMFPGNRWGGTSASGVFLGEYVSSESEDQRIDISALSVPTANPTSEPEELIGTFTNTRSDSVQIFALDPQTNQWIDEPYLSLGPGESDQLTMYENSVWLLMEKETPLGEYVSTAEPEQAIDIAAFATSAGATALSMSSESLLEGTFFNSRPSSVAIYALDPTTGTWIEPPYHILPPGEEAPQAMLPGNQWLVMEGEESLGIYVTTDAATQTIDTGNLPSDPTNTTTEGAIEPSPLAVDPSGKWEWIDSSSFNGTVQINDSGGNIFLNFDGKNWFGLRREGIINIYDSPEGQNSDRFTLTLVSNSEAALFLPGRPEGTQVERLQRVPKDPEGDWTRISDEAPFKITKAAFGLELINELRETEIWLTNTEVPDAYLYDHTLIDGERIDTPQKSGRSLVMITDDDIQVSGNGEIIYGLEKGASPALHVATRLLIGQWTASDGQIYDFDDSDPGLLRMGLSRDNYDEFRIDPGDSNRYLYSYSRRNGRRFNDSEKDEFILILQGSDKAALKREGFQTESIETYRKGTTKESLIDLTGNWIWDPTGRKNFQASDEGVRSVSLVHSKDETEPGITMVENSFPEWRDERRTEEDHKGVLGTRQTFSYNSDNHFFDGPSSYQDLDFYYKKTRDNWARREQKTPTSKEFSRLSFSTRDRGELLVGGKTTHLLRVLEADPPTLSHTAYSIDVNETTWEGFEGSEKAFTIHFLQGGTGLVGFYPFDQDRCFTAFLKRVGSKLVYQEYKQPIKPEPGVSQEEIHRRANITLRVDFHSDTSGTYTIDENGSIRTISLKRIAEGESISSYLTPDLSYEEWLKEDYIGPSPNTVVQDSRSGEDFSQPPLRGQWIHCITGYSAPFVNPLNLAEEKGTRLGENSFIFENPSLTRYYYSTPGFEYSVPLMFHPTDLSGGGSVSTLQVYATEQDRREGIGSAMGMNASAPPFKGMSSVSGDFSSSRNSSTQKRISQSEIGFQSMSWGAEHWLTLHKNEIRLHPDFKAYILAESNFIYRDDYKEFFDRYGTHYPISTLFGGYATVERHVTRKEISNSQMRARSDGGGVSAFGIGANLSISEDSAKTAGTTEESEWVNKFHKGGTGSGEAWSVSPDPSSHVPIKVELRPIYDLIRPEVFGLRPEDPIAITLESRRAEMRMWYHFYMGEIAAINEQAKEASNVTTSDYPPRYYEIEVAEIRNKDGKLVRALGAENTALNNDWGDGPELYGHLKLSAFGSRKTPPKVLLANTQAHVEPTPASQDYFMHLWEESRKKMIHEVREVSGNIDPIESTASFRLEPASIRRRKSLDGKYRDYPYYDENSVELYLHYSFHDDDRESAENIIATGFLWWEVVEHYALGSQGLVDPDDELAVQGLYGQMIGTTNEGKIIHLGGLRDILRTGEISERGIRSIRWAHPTGGEVYLTLKITEVSPQTLDISNPQSLGDLLPTSPVLGGRN